MQVIIDGLPVHYELTGKGKLVLLLHGWGDSVSGLQSLQKSLQDKYQVLAVDLPGFGATQMPPATWGLDEYADFIQALLNKLEMTDAYAVIGHSNGGALAIRAISKGTLQPKKLVLLAASGVRNQQPTRRKVLLVVAKIGRALTFWLPKATQKKMRKKLYGSVGSDLLVVPGMEDVFKRIITQDVQVDCQNIAQPTLLIYGDKDQDAPAEYGQKYQELIANSELEIVPSGHFVHIEQQEQVVAAIRSFL